MRPRQVTPRSMVLDLLRVAPPPGAIAVRSLVHVGAMFGFESNAVRVATTRLVRDGLLERDERSSYRLAPAAAPLTRVVQDWRRGDARMRRWTGEWLAVWHPRGGGRRERKHSVRALELLGFREAVGGTWVRPDNLALDCAGVAERAAELGLAAGATMFIARGFPPERTGQWGHALWSTPGLTGDYRRALDDLERSEARLGTLPPPQAAVEAFALGGAAIRILVLDPLLPDDILDGTNRRALHAAMLRYDRGGRRVWRGLIAAASDAPTHLSTVAHG